MMAEGDFCRAQLGGRAVEDPATQARAEGAGGFPFRDLLFDDTVGVLFDNLVLNPQLFQIFRQNMLGEARLFLVEVDRYQAEADWRALLQIAQNFQHGVAVFTAGEADHNAVAVFDHVEVSDGFAHVTTQTLLQFVQIVLFFFTNFLILLHLIVTQKSKWIPRPLQRLPVHLIYDKRAVPR